MAASKKISEFVDKANNDLTAPIDGVIREAYTAARVMIWSCSAYRSMCDALYDQFQSGAGVILYRMGEGYGAKLSKAIPTLILSPEMVIQVFEKATSSAGWGKLQLKMADKRSAECIVENSAFLLYRNEIGPVTCHFLAGVLGGVWSGIFGKETKVQEVKCGARGNRKVCKFKLSTEAT